MKTNPLIRLLSLAALGFLTCSAALAQAQDLWVNYEGAAGPGKGKHVVLISGDEEYRSEEGLPQLGKILATEHGFRCTVLFAVNPKTLEIDPNFKQNIPGLEALKDADLLILLTRFRDLPDDQMKQVDDYLKSGRPVIGLRTATHAFDIKRPEWAHYGNYYAGNKTEWKDGFGRLVLGEHWINHHGEHKKQSTRGIIAPDAKDNPIVRGLKDGDIWGDSDVYAVRLPLPSDSKPIVLGQVLVGMNPDDKPLEGPKNQPMMPVGWTKSYQLPGGKPGKAFATTMGAATDLLREGTRRMIVNAAYSLLGMQDQIPPGGTKVDLVGDYKPTRFGFDGYRRGVKPADHMLPLVLQKKDHISIIGNTLPDRMQHDGWLETFLQNRFPTHELVFRNLGFSADELTIRNRSEGFGDPDHWLAKNKTDVVFAFFGFNESFRGDEGLAKFKADLQAFIKHTREQKYNGQGAPRLVLFSPIAHENLKNPNLPDGREDNERLARYTQAMAEVARASGVTFVDLFTPSKNLYEKAAAPLTINGVHLTDAGNRQLAEVIDSALFGHRAAAPDEQQLGKIRDAVRDKNFYWFNRYRTVDGYSIYGGRSYLKFVNNQTNREVMFREMDVLDVMTDNRDPRIWAVAQGHDLKVDDSNTPPFIPVISNFPGKGPNGTHIFLSGEEEISKMTVAPGMKVNLFASEEKFPELVNPVQMAFDTKGRLWVAAWGSYPHWKPKEDMNDKLLILEDTDGDGVADKCTTFADHLHCPTGFEFWNGGVLIADAPGLLFLKDSNGGDKADVRTRMLDGLDSADTHHTSNSFTLGPGGDLYFQEGIFHRTQVETPYGPVRNFDACVWRFEPRTWKFERYAPYGFANPHGHVFDRWGQDIVHDGTGAVPYHAALFSGNLPDLGRHRQAPQVYNQRTRPCGGTEILSSRQFPDANQGNLLVTNVIGFQGILQYHLADDGASFAGKEVEPIVSSSDANFRPCDIEIGGDGAIYFTDWHNPIIGHMQHNLRDPNRDRTHGRVYRVSYPGRPLLKPAQIAGQPIEHLLELLKEPEDRVRYRARIELSGRESKAVIAAAQKWLAGLDSRDANYEHNRLEALWVHQHHNIVNVDLLRAILASPEARARAAGVRVLCYWRDRVPGALDLLRTAAADGNPRVRLEAVRAASYFSQPEAIEVVAIAAEQGSDRYLDYTRGETLKALEPVWKKALADGHDIPLKTAAGKQYLLRQLPLDALLAQKRTPSVYLELLDRPGVRDEHRLESIAALAKIDNKSPLQVLFDAIRALDAHAEVNGSVVADLVRLLATRPAGDLAQARQDIERLASDAHQPVVRQVALAALVGIDRSPDKAWQLASRSPASLRDFLAAVPFISDVGVRASVYPLVRPLLKESSKNSADPAGDEALVRRAAMDALTSIRGQEPEVFHVLAAFVRDNVDRPTAVRSLQRIPRQFWAAADAKPLLDVLLADVRKTPAAERTSGPTLDALEFADALTSLLPADEAKRIRGELRELGVRVIRIGTLPERMSYDKELIAVSAGKPVEIIFENVDLMPHNLVILQPGALQEVGLAAEASALQPGALERNYVPPSNRILLASRLLPSRQSQKLSFKVPAEPGVYPYVCTYPGHWRRMYGALYVVSDLDQYLAGPEAYLASHPLAIKDDLLKENRPRTEWKFEDLSALVSGMSEGRSFSNGRQMFQVANCVACHQLGGVGQQFGPDLKKLERERSQPVEIFRDIVSPSERINEKFQTEIFITSDGKTVTGLVLEENPQTVKIMEDPLAKKAAVVLKKSDVEQRTKSKVSLMPKGLLDKLTRDEILDLVAYIGSRGDEKHAFFQGGGHEHEHHH